jgi:hypothetical protein
MDLIGLNDLNKRIVGLIRMVFIQRDGRRPAAVEIPGFVACDGKKLGREMAARTIVR